MAAYELFHTCIKIISQKSSEYDELVFKKSLDEFYKGLKIGSIEATHGSFLILNDLLSYGGRVRLKPFECAISIQSI